MWPLGPEPFGVLNRSGGSKRFRTPSPFAKALWDATPVRAQLDRNPVRPGGRAEGVERASRIDVKLR